MMMYQFAKLENRERGFTLLEMIIVIAIVGILSSIAVPSYNRFRISNRISGIASDLHSSFNLARSEALKRGASVGVCVTTNPNDTITTPACNTAIGDGWGSGWLVYVDVNNNRTFDPDSTSTTSDELIYVRGQALQDTTQGTIVPNDGTINVSFGVTGQSFTATNFVINAPTNYTDETRSVCLSIGGRARIGKSSNCT